MSDLHYHVVAANRARSGPDPLFEFLSGARRCPVMLSLREVRRLDAARLQTLLVAQQQWQADGAAFRITDIAPSFREGLDRLGLAEDHFETGETT